MNEAIIVKVRDEMGFLAFSEPVLNDLREVLSRACDVLETPNFVGILTVEYL